MELTIDLIIATSSLLALLCWGLAGYYVHQIRHRIASLWFVSGLLAAACAGFFIWAAIPLWTSI
ncbi:hypothetical protein [Lactiplantibacillus plajomi]|uniref:Uncharacterized protein n=1 Tax=Lactiplantibacillus plajomi TaxID=1457217 RepID=A0ABV6K5Q6_9LACO|nr:hypothetical protein [Lactiplantibacillus plajomi]